MIIGQTFGENPELAFNLKDKRLHLPKKSKIKTLSGFL